MASQVIGKGQGKQRAKGQDKDRSQVSDEDSDEGHWLAGAHVDGKPGMLYGTSVGVFILAIPNRYLPILQEGRIDDLQQRFTGAR